MAKGEVKVGVDKGWLRLIWSFQGKRYFLTLGLPDTQANRQLAHGRATQIHLDIISGNFDPTLSKYKPGYVEKSVRQPSITDLFEQFIQFKAKLVDPRTLEKYKTLLGQIVEVYGNQTNPDPNYLIDHLERKDNGRQLIKSKLHLLSACYAWGIDRGLAVANPWEKLPSNVRVPPKEAPRPFTHEEVVKILNCFKGHQYYGYLHDYVFFLFGTGVRISEAIGLRWYYLNDDCTNVEIIETLTRGKRKTTKTNRSRQFKLSEEITGMLMARKPEIVNPDELVFPSARGGVISDHCFRNRAWKTVLTEAKVTYRKPYNTRSTFISHALAKGMHPMTVAQITGHDPQVLYEHYAGVIEATPKAPSLFGQK